MKLVDRLGPGRGLVLRADPTILLSPRPVDDLAGLLNVCGSHFFPVEWSNVVVGELGDGGVLD